MIYFIWFFWVLNQYIIFIILLNFLISIISESYDNVMCKSLQSKYQNRCLINREVRLTMKKFGLNKDLNITTMSANCIEFVKEENVWNGFVKTI